MLLGGCHVYDWMDSIQITGMEWKGLERRGWGQIVLHSNLQKHKFGLCFYRTIYFIQLVKKKLVDDLRK